MAILSILRFPDPRLRAVAEPVERFDADLRQLAADLLETMRAAPGVGITAPHVGLPLRLVVLELTPGEVRTYVNPQVLWASAETSRATEGSVSMPGVTEEVERPAKIRLTWSDLDGTAHEEEAEGFLATCHQHEIDQLDGIFWL
ncbi:MAG TPA: peptide deformylase [Bosea sp. (in: a-proteobacteria)]|jgi:peptide deformylase|uniref:peptide deformylase n=1 Tax=Bosea sp. (in: a-proteobacteria) TaxID=1871050 RepID=UPI002DDCF5DA|nr:peptide deformylase [Bosea sp. (in: a-proteobacteria)]HEV2553990.1 peptide deformylase [Bosea sp. (in: a-proteobacteria)]